MFISSSLESIPSTSQELLCNVFAIWYPKLPSPITSTFFIFFSYPISRFSVGYTSLFLTESLLKSARNVNGPTLPVIIAKAAESFPPVDKAVVIPPAIEPGDPPMIIRIVINMSIVTWK
jgi:hypothetical protein